MVAHGSFFVRAREVVPFPWTACMVVRLVQPRHQCHVFNAAIIVGLTICPIRICEPGAVVPVESDVRSGSQSADVDISPGQFDWDRLARRNLTYIFGINAEFI